MSELKTHHVGIVVRDLDGIVPFYRDALGFELLAEFTLSGDGIATAIDVEDVTGDFAHLSAGDVRIELIEYDPAGDDVGADAVNQIGAQHIGFSVDDLEAFYEELPEGADPLSDPQRTESGAKILFFRDPEGNFIEIIER